MNTPVKFEIAKLLEEQGYPFEFITVGELKEVPLNIPTVAEVVMWLYEKHEIWIISSYELAEDNITKEWFWIAIKDGEEVAFNYGGYTSPTEAYEATITYCLNNLL